MLSKTSSWGNRSWLGPFDLSISCTSYWSLPAVTDLNLTASSESWSDLTIRWPKTNISHLTRHLVAFVSLFRVRYRNAFDLLFLMRVLYLTIYMNMGLTNPIMYWFWFCFTYSFWLLIRDLSFDLVWRWGIANIIRVPTSMWIPDIRMYTHLVWHRTTLYTLESNEMISKYATNGSLDPHLWCLFKH